MKFIAKTIPSSQVGCIVLPFFEKEIFSKQPIYKNLSKETQKQVSELESTFQSKNGNTQFVPHKSNPLLFIGFGVRTELKTEDLRRSYSSVIKQLKKQKISNAQIFLPDENKENVKAIFEGVILGGYEFLDYKKVKKDEVQIKEICFISKEKKLLEDTQKISDSIFFIRDIVNKGPSDYTPQDAEKIAKQLAKNSSIKCQIWDAKKLQKENMNGIYGVGRGSENAPRMIMLEYKKSPKNKKPFVFIGKGVCFDSGGYNLKPSGGIETMKLDMAGSATVFGLFHLLAHFKPNMHVIGLCPMVENLVSHNAFKPGDILRMHNGKTVEIMNTDAEGRLILADALSYASSKLNPEYIVDLATLTGAVMVALGEDYTGSFTNNEAFHEKLKNCFKAEDEKVWQLPMDEDYKKKLKSQIADLSNISPDRYGGAISAALFLQYFVDKKIPWVHLDIAGAAYAEKEKYYESFGGTGATLRSLWKLLNQ